MYEKIVDEDPYVTPMMITLQFTTWEELGLIITYKLQFLDVSLLENNFSDHGAID
jgi:hypothetical protein